MLSPVVPQLLRRLCALPAVATNVASNASRANHLYSASFAKHLECILPAGLPCWFSAATLFLVRCATYVLIFVSCAAANSVTFAQFTDLGSQNFFLTNNDTAGTQTLSATDAVSFTYSNVPGLPFALQGPLAATLTLSATSNQNVGLTTISGAQYAYIGGFSGSFQFTLQGSGYQGNTDLLSGTFHGQSVLLGVEGGQSASFSDSTSSSNTSEVNFISNIVTFVPQQENFSFSLSSIFDTQQHDAGFNVGGPGNTDVDNFNASSAGTFASDPAPVFAAEGAPFEYAAMGLGLLLLVAFLRKRAAQSA